MTEDRTQGHEPGIWRGPWPIVAAAAVLLLVLLGIAWAARERQSQPAPAPASGSASSVVAQAATIPSSTLEKVGTGGVTAPLQRAPSSPSPAGPTVLYVGAEFCPFCAAERWSLVVALSRFGRFRNVGLTSSASTDVFPDTPTFTFRAASYESAYVRFESVELSDRNRQPLQAMNTHQQQLFTTYDTRGSIPFLDLGNKFIEVGAGYIPDVLAGQKPAEVAALLKDPSAPATQRILGNANYLIAAICTLTSNQPAAVCSGPLTRALEARLAAS